MQFLSRLAEREAPINGGSLRVAPDLIRADFVLEGGFVWNAPVQTLPDQNTQLDFRHIQPTAVLGGVVELQLLGQPPRFLRGKGFIERGWLMGVEIVQDDPDHLRPRIALINQPLHLVSKIHFRAVRRHRDLPPARLGFTEHKQVASPFALISIIRAARVPSLHGQGSTDVGQQLFAGFVKVDLRALGIIGLGIQVQDILPLRDKLRAYLRNTPLLFEPGLERVFLSTRPTVSAEQLSANPSSTTRSASNCSVHRSRPPGAVLHASAMSRACPFSWSTGGLPGRGRSLKAPRCAATKRRRVRSTVGTLV